MSQHQNLLDDLSGVGSGKADYFLIQCENDIMCHAPNSFLHVYKTLEDLQGVLPDIPVLSQGPTFQISSMNTMSDFNRYLRVEKKNFEFKGGRRLFNIGSEKLSSELNNDDEQQKFRRASHEGLLFFSEEGKCGDQELSLNHLGQSGNFKH